MRREPLQLLNTLSVVNNQYDVVAAVRPEADTPSSEKHLSQVSINVLTTDICLGSLFLPLGPGHRNIYNSECELEGKVKIEKIIIKLGQQRHLGFWFEA